MGGCSLFGLNANMPFIRDLSIKDFVKYLQFVKTIPIVTRKLIVVQKYLQAMPKI